MTCGQTVLIVDIRFVMNSFAVLLTLYREDLLVLRCHPKSPRETRSRCRDELVSATLRNRLLMDYFLPPTPLRA